MLFHPFPIFGFLPISECTSSSAIPVSMVTQGQSPSSLAFRPRTYPRGALLSGDFSDAEFSCQISLSGSYSSSGSAAEWGGPSTPPSGRRKQSITDVVYAHPCFDSALLLSRCSCIQDGCWLQLEGSISFHHQGPDLEAAVTRSHPFQVRISLTVTL